MKNACPTPQGNTKEAEASPIEKAVGQLVVATELLHKQLDTTIARLDDVLSPQGSNAGDAKEPPYPHGLEGRIIQMADAVYFAVRRVEDIQKRLTL